MAHIYGLRRAVGIVVMACTLILIASVAGAAPNLGGPTRSTNDKLDQKRYVAAGDQAYVIGSEDGRFPPMGWHIRGEMGGVWAHPIKLLDGYWFALDGQWIPPASESFTTGAGGVQMEFPQTDDLNVTRTEFSPDGSPVVLVGLTLQNPDSASKSVEVTMDARSEIMAAYPWGWTTPNAKDCNGKDEASFDPQSRTLTFEDSNLPCKAVSGQTHYTGYAAVGASTQPASAYTGDDYWGPVTADTERAGYLENGNGTGGELVWNLDVDGNQETTLWIAVAGSRKSQTEAQTAAQDALNDPEGLLSQKVADRQALLARTQVNLPDTALQAAFDWGKLNMADLKRTVTDAQIRDVNEGQAYPAPTDTIQTLTGIGAGYPDYPWYFGTDGAYTAYPLVVSGQWDTAEKHLRSIRDVSRVVNGSTGKVVHEVVTDGSVYFGTNADPGNTNETAEFATAVDLIWRWSGDNRFRDEMYDFVNRGVHYITSQGCPTSGPYNEGTCDNDGDGWPEGSGMVERGGMGEEKLDNTAYTWQALRALQHMAKSKGDSATASWANRKANAMEANFDTAWWMGDGAGGNLELYADSLCNSAQVPEEGWINYCQQAGQQLQQRHWINATPMETLLAPENRATSALDTLESPDFTDECGLYHTGVGGGPDGTGERKCWTLPSSVMAVGEANYGRLGDEQALFYMKSIADQLDLEMPGALPEIAPSPDYQPFVDFRDRAMFMQAWSSYGVQWPVVNNFLGIRPDIPAGRLTVMPDIPESWPGLSVQNLKIGGGTMTASASRENDQYTTQVSAPAGWKMTIGHTLPSGATVESVTLDGNPANDYEQVHTTRGLEVRVNAKTGGSHSLVVTTG